MALTNTNRQVWILTSYGINRITEIMQSPNTERLFITKIKVGDANDQYYVPVQGTDNDLRHPIVQEGLIIGFPIIEKSIDNQTVTFKSFIPENSGGYNIREIGLYETINGEDKCFALGTCEPIVKPAYDETENYGYAVAIDYSLNINSVNLASVYDRIELDSDNEYVTREMFDTLTKTVLFVEGNLMDQISINTHLLGLNRAQQLAELVEATQNAYANVALTNIYTNLLNAISGDRIKGFWGFGYTEKYDTPVAIKDFGPLGNNLSLSRPLTSLETGKFDIFPYINFSNDYFYAPFVESLLMDEEFTLIYTGALNSADGNSTILAQSNPYASKHNWSVQITSQEAIQVKVYTDKNNYDTYTSGAGVLPLDPFTIVVTYKDKKVNVYLNGSKLSLNKVSVGDFTGLAQEQLETTSYLTSVQGQVSDLINSKVSCVILLDIALEDTLVRAINLSLMAVTGWNIFRNR